MDCARRKVIQSVCLGSGFVGISGCLGNSEASSDSASQNANNGADEVVDELPEYETGPEGEEEYRDRSDEISDALYDALSEQDWFIETGRTASGAEWVVFVRVHDIEPAEEYVPTEWGGIDIEVEKGDSPEPE
ncbi:hypothetical protein [Natronobacterium texcoconense]|uniref:hypothetical protein n=1 Tax=Natronobacterium texcoconense TaxID=1095778 RepID=UPI0011141080|nr:hypothetical protein [Natronobacterium texcoconense]